jgi:putative peptidoglycan lipid II flippase
VERTGRHAILVASGILLSRVAGVVRQSIFNHYFGLTDEADAFLQAIKIPNFLSNLFGEGVLSASFIPVYSKLLAEGDEEEAGSVAGAVGAILALTTAVLVTAGVLATPLFIDAIVPGYHGAKRELTIRLVRILFPGVGMMVMSAWCLGILNSHRKFLLSYSAPVIWNAAMIATLVIFGRSSLVRLAVILAWGSVIGSALTFGAQLPAVFALARRLRFRLQTQSAQVREVLRTFGPVFVSRGVVQISGYVDSVLASLLPEGAAAALLNAQSLNMLPISLFGMSISAAELPAMSSELGNQADVKVQLQRRLNGGLRRIAFFVVPSAMAFLAFGDLITEALYQSGRFSHEDSVYLWGILAGSAVGLLASTMGRLYSSTYYAMRDTRTPLRFAVIRVALTTGLGYLASKPLPLWIGINPLWGVAGLTASAGIAGWIEFTLLRHTLNQRIGVTGLSASLAAKLWLGAVIAAAAGWGVKLTAGHITRLWAIAILGVYGVVYFGATAVLRVREAAETLVSVGKLSKRIL